MNIQIFTFNPVQVNSFIISNNKKEALVIDPGCYFPEEHKTFDDYIADNKLTIKEIVVTHPHFDHLLGLKYVADKYNVIPKINSNSKELLSNIKKQVQMFGFDNFELCELEYNLEEGDTIGIEDIEFDVLYTPGHADGSICLYNDKFKILFSGDVLFRSSVGRTDLATGDMELLLNNIKTKIFTLPEDVIVYPGHGSKTSIKFEKLMNPFF